MAALQPYLSEQSLDENMTKIDLSKRLDEGNWAKYLPAISTAYVKHMQRLCYVDGFIGPERVPKGFEYGMPGMDFLNPDDSYFHYKYGLYSTGHAELNLDKCDYREPMIHKRDRERTVIIGDSGGFQIATGIFKLDWTTVQTPAGDELREKILRFLEYTADWSMTLDVPAVAALPPFNKKTGLHKASECLDISEYNLKYFMKNRVPGATKFLNVISGSSPETSKEWYDRIKIYSTPDKVEEMGFERERTFEGWAFAGINMRNMHTTLSRILDLREDGLLKDKDWIHFLGVGRLDWSCFLTSIERQLRKHDNPNLTISFDAASPFVSAGGYALNYTYNHFSADRLTYAMEKVFDSKDVVGSDLAMPFQGPIMERLKLGDLCVYGYTDANKQGKIGKTAWDSNSYAMAMAHNVYTHIHAVQEINRLADIDYVMRPKVDYRDWYVMRNTKRQSNLSPHVPNTIIFFNDFVARVLDPANPDPRGMLDDSRIFLDHISFGIKKYDNFNSMFGDVDDYLPTEEEMADMDDHYVELDDDVETGV